MAFFDTYDLDTNQPWPFNPRLLAKTKIKVNFFLLTTLYFDSFQELENLGFQLCIGVENEFRLFHKTSLLPFPNKMYFIDQFVQATLMLPYVRNLKRQMDKLGLN